MRGFLDLQEARGSTSPEDFRRCCSSKEEVSRLEANKKPGVCYAVTKDGVELPVVDSTHPAFALSVAPAEQEALVEKFLQEGMPFSFLPKFIRDRLLQYLLRDSVLAQGIRRARGSFMTGMNTYLLKLGPDMLGNAYAKPIDRKIAAALPVLAVRLRLQDMADLMADSLQGTLSQDLHRPLHFVNIAGGPAVDSLNALILLRTAYPGILKERSVVIEVLDLDDAGPVFGNAALQALSDENAPLHGIQIAFRHVVYDWSNVSALCSTLKRARAAGALIICSSEGGLFEYGTDEAIESNLRALRGDDVLVVGSVTRADKPIQRLREIGSAATCPRGLEVFASLAMKAGWVVKDAIERPFSDQVVPTQALV